MDIAITFIIFIDFLMIIKKGFLKAKLHNNRCLMAGLKKVNYENHNIISITVFSCFRDLIHMFRIQCPFDNVLKNDSVLRGKLRWILKKNLPH